MYCHIMYLLIVGITLVNVVFGIDPTVTIEATNPKTKINALKQKEMVVLKNKDASITCTVINREADKQVAWIGLRPDDPSFIKSIATAQDAKNPFKYQVDQPSTMSWRLTIQNLQVADEMKYVCQVSIGNQKFAQAERWVRVVEKPQIMDLQTSSDTTVSEDDPISIRCNASGRPAPVMKWQRLAGGVLPNGGREHRNSVLDMGKATQDHRGYYKCTAQNEIGKDQRLIQVIVRFKPRAKPKELIVEQAVGYRKELLCVISGYPVPTSSEISWSRNGKAISGSNYKVTYIESANSRVMTKLTIYNVQHESFGTYTCTATNNEGEGKAEVELKQSTAPTPDFTGRIRSNANLVSFSITTTLMLSAICFYIA